MGDTGGCIYRALIRERDTSEGRKTTGESNQGEAQNHKGGRRQEVKLKLNTKENKPSR